MLRLLGPAFLLALISSGLPAQDTQPAKKKPDLLRKEVTFASIDKLSLTADIYTTKKVDPKRPFIVLCHQAGTSRGEYRDIAPRLVRLGFNCLALDQRAGGEINGVRNETAARAKKAKKKTGFLEARPDIVAALGYVRKNYAPSKLLLWGSSYSATLVLDIAARETPQVDGVLSFSPGEYFMHQRDFAASALKALDMPVFLTGAKMEVNMMERGIVKAAGEKKKQTLFRPKARGNHGSATLWPRFAYAEEYWTAVESFLKPFVEKAGAKKPAKPTSRKKAAK